MKIFLQAAFATMPMWTFGTIFILASCSKKPAPGYPPHQFQEASEEMLAGKASMDLDEKVLDLEAPTWAILFDFDSYRLKESCKLNALVAYLGKPESNLQNSPPPKAIHLSGHASEEGATEYNLALGAQRAVAVRSYLEAAGVPVDRITWESFGEEKPVTHDPEMKHLNRRVEILIQKGTP